MTSSLKYFEYQKEAISFGLVKPYVGLFLEMGLGKTLITLSILEHLQIFGGFQPTLLMAPKAVCYSTWPDEIEQWGFDLTPSIMVGKPAQRLDALHDPADVYIANYDSLQWLTEQEEFKKFRILIMDELSMLKSTKSVRHKALWAVRHQFMRRIGLTGMPVPNHLSDVYGMMRMIDNGKTFPKKGEFMGKYFYNVSKNDYPIYKPTHGSEDKIHKLMAPTVLTMKADDYIDLPEFMPQKLMLGMDRKMQEQYDEIEKEFMLTISKDIYLDVKTAAVKSVKLRQLTSGFVYNGTETHKLNTDKLKACREFIESLQGQPCIIAYNFKQSRDMLLETFKGCLHIGAGMTKEQVNKTIKRWNTGKYEVMIVHPKPAARGLNLQFGGHHLLWYELTWVLDDYSQLNARLRRHGQESSWIGIHHLLFKNTIDEAQYASLMVKQDTNDRLYKAITNYHRRKRCLTA